MAERPILFSGPMVRATLAGKKTQTRRIVNHAHVADADTWMTDELGWWEFGVFGEGGVVAHGDVVRCPYGARGGHLWVRETWSAERIGADVLVAYRASCADDGTFDYVAPDGSVANLQVVRWKPSIFMPRAASRLTLEVTGVRVERLQAISDGDIEAEGFEGTVEAFANGWDTINGKRAAWKMNPWVWVVEFKVKTCGAGFTDRDDAHREFICKLKTPHAGPHRDGDAMWTDGEHHEGGDVPGR